MFRLFNFILTLLLIHLLFNLLFLFLYPLYPLRNRRILFLTLNLGLALRCDIHFHIHSLLNRLRLVHILILKCQ